MRFNNLFLNTKRILESLGFSHLKCVNLRPEAKAAGVDLSLIKITKIGGVYGLEDADLPADLAKRNIEYEGAGQLPEVEKRINQYNRAVRKLVKAIGGEYHGFKTGYGAWHYTFGSMTAGERLAAANID